MFCQKLPDKPDGHFKCIDCSCSTVMNSVEVNSTISMKSIPDCVLMLRGLDNAKKHSSIHFGIKSFQCNECALLDEV